MPFSALSRPRAHSLAAPWVRARRAGKAAGAWIASRLPETLLQCLLIVVSILLALGVDEWKDARKDRELKLRSLTTFANELESNRQKLLERVPTHEGLRGALTALDAEGKLRTPDEFFATLGTPSFQPLSLRAMAWQTAISTGVLRLLDYHTVNVLAITYGDQANTERSSERRLPDFLRTGTAPPGSAHAMVRTAARYVDGEAAEERDLLAAYDAAIEEIAAARRALCGRARTRECTPPAPPPAGDDPVPAP